MKRVFAALLCVILVLALLPASALAAYSTTAADGTVLVYPDEKDYYTRPFMAKVKTFEGGNGIYIMPLPESGHGTIGSVASGKKVTILAEKSGFFFFVTSNGHYGWNGTKWFDFKEEQRSVKNRGAEGSFQYPTVSTLGVRLAFPEESAYLEEETSATVKTGREGGSIYLLPKAGDDNGIIGTVNEGETVTVLAEVGDYVFFQTEDGRYGWNHAKWFE